MTEQAQGQPTPQSTPETSPAPQPASPERIAGYSQKDLDKAAGSARKDEREKALSNFAQELGFPDPDSIKALVQQQKEAEDAKKSEVEKLAGDRDKVAADRDKIKAELEHAYEHIATMTQEAALRTALAGAEINPQRVEAAIRLVDLDDLDVDRDGRVTGLEVAVEAVKEQVPEWFQPQRITPRVAPDATRQPIAGDLEGSKLAFNDMLRQLGLSR